MGTADSKPANPNDRATDPNPHRKLVFAIVVAVLLLGTIVVSVVVGRGNSDGNGNGETNSTDVSAQGNKGKGDPTSAHPDAEVRASQRPLSPEVIAVVKKHTSELTAKVISRTNEFEKRLRTDLGKAVREVAEDADSWWHLSVYRGKLGSWLAPESYREWVDDLANSKVFRIADIEQAAKALFDAVQADFREYQESLLKDIRREADVSAGLAPDWDAELSRVVAPENLWTARVHDIVRTSAGLDVGAFVVGEVAAFGLATALFGASAATGPFFLPVLVVGLVVSSIAAILIEESSVAPVSRVLSERLDGCISAILDGGELAHQESNFRYILARSEAFEGPSHSVSPDAQTASAIRQLEEKRLLLAQRRKALEQDQHYSETLRPAFRAGANIVRDMIAHCHAKLRELDDPALADQGVAAVNALNKELDGRHWDLSQLMQMQGGGSISQFRSGAALGVEILKIGADAQRLELAERLQALRRSPRMSELHQQLYEIRQLESACALGVRPLLTDLVYATEREILRSID